jgi:hypothetical protein
MRVFMRLMALAVFILGCLAVLPANRAGPVQFGIGADHSTPILHTAMHSMTSEVAIERSDPAPAPSTFVMATSIERSVPWTLYASADHVSSAVHGAVRNRPTLTNATVEDALGFRLRL